jgi:hypothetical protein
VERQRLTLLQRREVRRLRSKGLKLWEVAAVTRAMALSRTGTEQQTISVPETAIEVRRGVEL